MTKKWKYHKSHSFETKDGSKISMITQLYQVGVYAIVNNDPAAQFNLTPNQLVTAERNLKKQEKEGEIKNLQFGIPITVTEDESGFYKEVN